MARISKAEQAEIARLRRNALAKVNRLNKLGIDNLPQVPKITSNWSRKDVNQAKQFLKSFTNRANQRWQFVDTGSGNYINKQTYGQIKREQNRVNRIFENANKRFDKLPYTLLGETKPTGRFVRDADDKEDARRYTRTTFTSQQEAAEYLARLKSINRRTITETDEALKENYIKAVFNVHGSDGEILINKIRNMSTRDFIKKYYTSDISVKSVYTEEDRGGELEKLLAYFE